MNSCDGRKLAPALEAKRGVRVEPIRDDDLDEVSRFLSDNLSAAYSADEWRSIVDRHWTTDHPNHGFLIRDGSRLIGAIGALYSRQVVRGQSELFCNIHGWCVLEEYRTHSLKLLLSLIGQTKCHMTALTPNPEAAKIYRALKFRTMESEQRILINVPGLHGGAKVISDDGKIEQLLSKDAAAVFREHRHLPLLEMVAVGRGETYCLIVFKKVTKARFRFAFVLDVSDVELFAKCQSDFRNHLLLRYGIVAFKIDSRFVSRPSLLSLRVRNSSPRLFYSRTLDASDVCGLYSELTVLP